MSYNCTLSSLTSETFHHQKYRFWIYSSQSESWLTTVSLLPSTLPMYLSSTSVQKTLLIVSHTLTDQQWIKIISYLQVKQSCTVEYPHQMMQVKWSQDSN